MKEIFCTILLAVWCLLGSYANSQSAEMLVNMSKKFDRTEVVVSDVQSSKGIIKVIVGDAQKAIFFSPQHPQAEMFKEIEKDISQQKPVKVRLDYYYGYDSSSYAVGSNLKFTRITTE